MILKKAIKNDTSLILNTTLAPSNGAKMKLTKRTNDYSLNINEVCYTCRTKQEVLDAFLCHINNDTDKTRQSCIIDKKKFNTDAILTSICDNLYKNRKSNNIIEFDTDLMIGYYWYRIKITKYEELCKIWINNFRYIFNNNEDLYNCFNRYIILFKNQNKNNTINILNIFLQYLKDNIDLDLYLDIDTDSFKIHNYVGPKIIVSTTVKSIQVSQTNSQDMNLYTLLIVDKSYPYYNRQKLYDKFKSYIEEYTKLNII